MAMAWVNGTTTVSGSNPTSLALSVSLTPGNYVFIGVVLAPTTASVSSITDNSATPGAYSRVSVQTTNVDLEIWVGIVPSTAPTTITVNLTGSATGGVAVLGQYSGFFGPATVGGTGATTGSSATPGLTPTRTISYANDFALSVIGWAIAASAPAINSNTGNLRESGSSTGATKVGAALVDSTSAVAGTVLTNDVSLAGPTSENWAATIMDLFTLTPNANIAVPSGGSSVYAGWPSSTVLVASTFQVTDAPSYVVLSVQRPAPFSPEGSPIIVDA